MEGNLVPDFLWIFGGVKHPVSYIRLASQWTASGASKAHSRGRRLRTQNPNRLRVLTMTTANQLGLLKHCNSWHSWHSHMHISRCRQDFVHQQYAKAIAVTQFFANFFVDQARILQQRRPRSIKIIEHAHELSFKKTKLRHDKTEGASNLWQMRRLIVWNLLSFASKF